MQANTLGRQLELSLGHYLPSVLGAVLVLIVGLIAALFVRGVIRSGMARLRVNERVHTQTASQLDIVKVAASIGFWFVILLTLIGVFSVLRVDGLYGPFSALVTEVMLYLPRILLAAVLALVAWVLATVLRAGVNRLMAAGRWDETLSESAGVRPISGVLGDVVYWLVLLLFLPAIVGALRIDGLMLPLADMTAQVTTMLPNIFAAVVIGVVGWLVAKVLRGLLTNLLAASGIDRYSNRDGLTEGVRLSQLGGTLVFILVIVPTLIAALDALAIRAISEPASDMLGMFLTAIPNILAAALILIVAWYLGRFVAGLLTRLLENLGVDRIPARLGLAHLFTTAPAAPVAPTTAAPVDQALATADPVAAAGMPEPGPPIVDAHGTPVNAPAAGTGLSAFVGRVALFFILLFATVEAAHRLGFTGVRDLLATFIAFGADVLLGAVILVVGYWLADVAARAIQRANPDRSVGLSRIARVAILGLVIAMGLRAMGIADDIVNLAFGLVLGAVAVATALAFGLGGRDAAGRVADRWARAYLERRGDNDPRP
ncbi:mechanosensitive ion channel [Luteimonas sp BLCC-B24]|uniref:mechanosensitive ion channel n=1 Tax=Luteimonas sp. BLCC-B24 TaxID=3025317 RepID=UPI00234D3FBD|nr:mechanosensitive ion channel [Luteimonas sp. BLCC-B24]MDC7806946.1 mechanosensitive ion channel [Luteimonas sp. BLCC-B24]